MKSYKKPHELRKQRGGVATCFLDGQAESVLQVVTGRMGMRWGAKLMCLDRRCLCAQYNKVDTEVEHLDSAVSQGICHESGCGDSQRSFAFFTVSAIPEFS